MAHHPWHLRVLLRFDPGHRPVRHRKRHLPSLRRREAREEAQTRPQGLSMARKDKEDRMIKRILSLFWRHKPSKWIVFQIDTFNAPPRYFPRL